MMLLFWITPKVNKSMHFQDGWLSGVPSLALGHDDTTWPPSENSHAHSLCSIALQPTHTRGHHTILITYQEKKSIV